MYRNLSSHHQKRAAHEKPKRRAANLGFLELANEASRASLSQGGPKAYKSEYDVNNAKREQRPRNEICQSFFPA